jgi:hypothetical protein
MVKLKILLCNAVKARCELRKAENLAVHLLPTKYLVVPKFPLFYREKQLG